MLIYQNYDPHEYFQNVIPHIICIFTQYVIVVTVLINESMKMKLPTDHKTDIIEQNIDKMGDCSRTPINLKGKVSEAEWKERVDLAALYRLIALHGWDDMIYTHISSRIPDAKEHFLINPWDMLFEEITASSLIKVDIEGHIISDTPYIINPAGFTIHSALHMAREDINCVLHLHTDDGSAVSTQKEGLLPISQHASVCYHHIAYHDYEGIALELDERQRLIQSIGDKHLMILRNHGTLSVGCDCATAYHAIFYLERACSIQIRARGNHHLITLDKDIVQHVTDQSQSVFNGYAGKLAWPGLLRKLDRIDPSFRD